MGKSMTIHSEGHYWYAFAASSDSRINVALPSLRSNRIELEGRRRCEKGTNVLVNIPDKTEDVYKKQQPVKKYFHPVVEKRGDQNSLDKFFE